jgi:hypothetical protein
MSHRAALASARHRCLADPQEQIDALPLVQETCASSRYVDEGVWPRVAVLESGAFLTRRPVGFTELSRPHPTTRGCLPVPPATHHTLAVLRAPRAWAVM